MSTEKVKRQLAACNARLRALETAMHESPVVASSSVYYTGVDLGTACVVLVVLDESRSPVAAVSRYADVVRDGMVLDYIGAVRLVGEMKAQLERRLETRLVYASAAVPPGTAALDGGVVKNVVEAAGFELTALLDEPTAANAVLQIRDGAIVDIGGGTTGIAVLREGQVVSVSDEATGGTHFSLVISGAYKLSYEEAEICKRDPARHPELLSVLKPVIEKIAFIIKRGIAAHPVQTLWLVGGTSCLEGIEQIVEHETGILTEKPENPLLVTPLGIAYGCAQSIME